MATKTYDAMLLFVNMDYSYYSCVIFLGNSKLCGNMGFKFNHKWVEQFSSMTNSVVTSQVSIWQSWNILELWLNCRRAIVSFQHFIDWFIWFTNLCIKKTKEQLRLNFLFYKITKQNTNFTMRCCIMFTVCFIQPHSTLSTGNGLIKCHM